MITLPPKKGSALDLLAQHLQLEPFLFHAREGGAFLVQRVGRRLEGGRVAREQRHNPTAWTQTRCGFCG